MMISQIVRCFSTSNPFLVFLFVEYPICWLGVASRSASKTNRFTKRIRQETKQEGGENEETGNEEIEQGFEEIMQEPKRQ
jgi:hypothetical protein